MYLRCFCWFPGPLAPSVSTFMSQQCFLTLSYLQSKFHIPCYYWEVQLCEWVLAYFFSPWTQITDLFHSGCSHYLRNVGFVVHPQRQMASQGTSCQDFTDRWWRTNWRNLTRKFKLTKEHSSLPRFLFWNLDSRSFIKEFVFMTTEGDYGYAW